MKLTLSLVFALTSSIAVAQQNVIFFDQVTDSALVNGQTILGTAVTIETWYLPLQGFNTNGMIFNEWRLATEDKQFGVGGTRNYGFLAGGSQSGEFASSNILSLNQWHHIAYVYDGSEQRLYIDGSKIGTAPGTGNPPLNSSLTGGGDGLAFFGRNNRNGEVKLSATGLVDTFRLSSSVRYLGDSFTVPGSVLQSDGSTEILYDFDVPIGTTTIPDRSSHGRDLLLNTRQFNSTALSLVADPLPGTRDVPEPSSLVTVLCGIAALSARRASTGRRVHVS